MTGIASDEGKDIAMGFVDSFRKILGRQPPPVPTLRPLYASTVVVDPDPESPPDAPVMPLTPAIAELEPYDSGAPEPPDIEVLAQLKLPSLPTFALRAAELACDLATPSRVVAEAIGVDPALAARIMRAANSPLYGFERHVATLGQAVTALGNQTVNSLIVVFAAADVMNSGGALSKRERALWRHSMGVAFAARELTVELRVRGGEEAFLCGLLHDIGKIFLIRHDPERYDLVLASEEEGAMLRAERDYFGATHPVVGAAVAHKWGLPPEVVRTISLHHQPGEAQHSLTLVRTVDLADMLANLAGYGLRAPEILDIGLTESAIALDLSSERLLEVWDRAQLAALEAISLFA